MVTRYDIYHRQDEHWLTNERVRTKTLENARRIAKQLPGSTCIYKQCSDGASVVKEVWKDGVKQ